MNDLALLYLLVMIGTFLGMMNYEVRDWWAKAASALLWPVVAGVVIGAAADRIRRQEAR